MTATPLPAPRSVARVACGWVSLALGLSWAAIVHQGLGAAPGGIPSEWWHPSLFLYESDFVGRFAEEPLPGAFVLGLPGLLAVIGTCWGTRSSLARTLAVASLGSAMLFAFYGLGARRPWEFFHWRGSLVMVGVAASVAAALCAPLLAASWLRLRPLWRAVVYLPLFAAVVTMLQGTTGTDERLPFNFAPWPAIPIFGFEIGAFSVLGVLAGLALAALAGRWWHERPTRALDAAVLGLLAPFAWLWLRFGALEGGSGAARAVLLAVWAAALFAAARSPGEGREARLGRRALHCALGAVLVWLPIASGRALATGDYTATRFVRAQPIIDALALHFEERDGYPDELEELIEHGYLERIPRPRVGLDALRERPLEFHYQSLGSSYVLEFVGTEWVQCAYNPPWDDEDYDEEDFEDEELEEGDLGGAWSCPESRPELW